MIIQLKISDILHKKTCVLGLGLVWVWTQTRTQTQRPKSKNPSLKTQKFLGFKIILFLLRYFNEYSLRKSNIFFR